VTANLETGAGQQGGGVWVVVNVGPEQEEGGGGFRVSETINDLRSSISGSVVIGQGHTVFDDAVDTNCR